MRAALLLACLSGALALPGCDPPKVVPRCPEYADLACDTRVLCTVVDARGCQSCVCERLWYQAAENPGGQPAAAAEAPAAASPPAAEGEGEGEGEGQEGGDGEEGGEGQEGGDGEEGGEGPEGGEGAAPVSPAAQ